MTSYSRTYTQIFQIYEPKYIIFLLKHCSFTFKKYYFSLKHSTFSSFATNYDDLIYPYGNSDVNSHVMPNNFEKLIGLLSRTLTNTEEKYSQVYKETLAIFYVKIFSYVYCNIFTLFSDTVPLVSLLYSSKSIHVLLDSRIQQYWI